MSHFRPFTILSTRPSAGVGALAILVAFGFDFSLIGCRSPEIRQPLGYAMVGGLIVSQALTLFTNPVVYLYLDRLSNAFANFGRSGDREPTESAQDSIKASRRVT